MPLCVLPNVITDSSPAYGSDLQENFVALRDSVNNVGGTQIAAASIDPSKIAVGAVQTAHLAGGAVTTAKIAASAVDNTKLAAAGVKLANLHSEVTAALNLHQQSADKSIAEDASDTFVFSGFDTALFPVINILVKEGASWRLAGTRDAGDGLTLDVISRIELSSPNYIVTVVNKTGLTSPAEFRVTAIGKKA